MKRRKAEKNYTSLVVSHMEAYRKVNKLFPWEKRMCGQYARSLVKTHKRECVIKGERKWRRNGGD